VTDLSHQQRTLELYIVRHLPVAVAMRVSVKTWDGRQLCLGAPLQCNINDKGTAFGGSLITLATLACWGVCWLGLLRDAVQADLVLVQQSSRFLRPVHSELLACAGSLSQQLWQQKLTQFQQSEQADLAIESQIMTLNRSGEQSKAMDYQSVFRLRPIPVSQ